jgi:sec-independent protein translocase protein TatA
MPFRIEPLDIVLILIVALLIFGPSRLPEIGRGIGKALNEFHKGTKGMVEGFTEEVSSPTPKPPPPPSRPLRPTSGNVCAQCGAANVPDATFCNYCGAKLAS